jgi:hypothetical protein
MIQARAAKRWKASFCARRDALLMAVIERGNIDKGARAQQFLRAIAVC